MTTEDLKTERIKLDQDILTLIQAFETKTCLQVKEIYISTQGCKVDSYPQTTHARTVVHV